MKSSAIEGMGSPISSFALVVPSWLCLNQVNGHFHFPFSHSEAWQGRSILSGTMQDYYATLGVSPSASEQEIRSAYRKLAVKYHPDRNPGGRDAERKFKEATEAYQVLADPQRRAEYDRFGREAGRSDSLTSSHLSSILDSFIGWSDLFAGFREKRSSDSREDDLWLDHEISLEDAASGGQTRVRFSRQECCSECDGSGIPRGSTPVVCSGCGGSGQACFQRGLIRVRHPCHLCQGQIGALCQECGGSGLIVRERTLQVRVPTGVDTGSCLRIAGEGNLRHSADSRGDLLLNLRVKDHEIFERVGQDLHCIVPAGFAQLALGALIEVPTLYGPAKLTIPPGTQSGASLKLCRAGMPHLNSSERGDLWVTLHLVTPTQLNTSQKDLLEQLAPSLRVDNRPLKRASHQTRKRSA
ncbi:MAG: J domain-containing protein [Acidobacteriota bacterium]